MDRRLRTILYISDSRLTSAGEELALQSLVSAARERNALVGITGALMFTQTNFIQFVEGPERAVGTLLEALGRDERHENMQILLDGRASDRRFARWTLAYCGPPQFVQADILAAAAGGDKNDDAKWRLVDMIFAFAAAGHGSSAGP